MSEAQPVSRPASLPRPTPARLLEGVLALGRDIHLGMDDRSLCQRFLGELADMFPLRTMAIRLDPRAPERRVVAGASGDGGARVRLSALVSPLEIKRSSLDKTGLGPAAVAAGRVRVVDTLSPVFEGDVEFFSVPLVAGGEIYGALDVGYPEGCGITDDDEATLIPIANNLSVALRNEKLHHETALLGDYLKKIIDNADALIVCVDRHWRITLINQAFVRLGGYEPAQVIGRDVRDWMPPWARAHLTSVIAHALAGRETAAVDLELRTSAGMPVKTVWNMAGIVAGRRVEAVVAVGQDVTRLKSLERQVIQAEKLATLGQLAAGVVHELNNPLTSIIVYTGYLHKKLERAAGADAILDAADAEKVRRILEGAERIQNFAKSLVAYARPSAGELDVVSINDVVRQSLSFCEHILKKPDVHVDVRLGELPPIYGVRGQLQQVLINLVTNAAHAVSGAGGRISIETRAIDEWLVELSVADTGVGIRPEDQERIFEPFFTTKTDGKGTGLGLSIVRNIVEEHRGAIAVSSTPGQGARFIITLPTGR